jgi:hypothetical protein
VTLEAAASAKRSSFSSARDARTSLRSGQAIHQQEDERQRDEHRLREETERVEQDTRRSAEDVFGRGDPSAYAESVRIAKKARARPCAPRPGDGLDVERMQAEDRGDERARPIAPVVLRKRRKRRSVLARWSARFTRCGSTGLVPASWQSSMWRATSAGASSPSGPS